MDPQLNRSAAATRPLPSLEFLKLLEEGISHVLYRWTALQMAVLNEWGGRDSRAKSEELAASIISWFSDAKNELYIDDLEALMEENMIGFFNAEIDDGSIEEPEVWQRESLENLVAEQLMVIHEECLQGRADSIEKLRQSSHVTGAASQSRQVIDENENESSDDEASEMMVDDAKQGIMCTENHKSRESCDEDGWTVVASRKNRVK